MAKKNKSAHVGDGAAVAEPEAPRHTPNSRRIQRIIEKNAAKDARRKKKRILAARPRQRDVVLPYFGQFYGPTPCNEHTWEDTSTARQNLTDLPGAYQLVSVAGDIAFLSYDPEVLTELDNDLSLLRAVTLDPHKVKGSLSRSYARPHAALQATYDVFVPVEADLTSSQDVAVIAREPTKKVQGDYIPFEERSIWNDELERTAALDMQFLDESGDNTLEAAVVDDLCIIRGFRTIGDESQYHFGRYRPVDPQLSTDKDYESVEEALVDVLKFFYDVE